LIGKLYRSLGRRSRYNFHFDYSSFRSYWSRKMARYVCLGDASYTFLLMIFLLIGSYFAS